MGSHFPRLAQVLTRCFAALGLVATLALSPVLAADKGVADALRSAFREAAREAKTSDEINPGYELLGIAESAQQQELPQIAAEAAEAFADLVKRVSANALKASGSVAEVTLDQFVDLRFMARTANLSLPQAALDDAMTKLFPSVRSSLEAKFNQAAAWKDKHAVADEIADLQASATQVMKDDLASDLSAVFDRQITELEALVDQAEAEEVRAQMRDALAETRKQRDDRLADAKINNINAVAALMQNQRDRSGDAATSGGDIGTQ